MGKLWCSDEEIVSLLNCLIVGIHFIKQQLNNRTAGCGDTTRDSQWSSVNEQRLSKPRMILLQRPS